MREHELCLITTCKGRLTQLQQSLGAAAAQPRCSCVVVDYSCPEQCGDWVERHYPTVNVVRILDQAGFNAARARNRGAAKADAPWLCFFDADVILDPRFAENILPMLQTGNYYLAQPRHKALDGTVICTREDFLGVGGYDEVYQGWSGEDRDLYYHFDFRGVTKQGFPQEWLTEIPHGDDLRVQHHAIKSPDVSQTLNTLYRHAKFDLMRLMARGLNDQERIDLYAEAGRLVQTWLQNQQNVQWQFPIRPPTILMSSEISSTLVYTVKPKAV